MQKIIDLIEEFGISNYKTFIEQYNLNLERKRENGDLKTPEEIILQNQKIYG